MSSLFPVKVPDGLLISAYGGGVNSVAVLVLLKQLGLRPHAIAMSNPGSEWPATIRYRDEIMQPWCADAGFPPIVVVDRISEGQFRPRANRPSDGAKSHSKTGLCYE